MDAEHIIDLTKDASAIATFSDRDIKSGGVTQEDDDFIIVLNPDFKEDGRTDEKEKATDLEILPPPLTLDDPSPSRNFKRRRGNKRQKQRKDIEENYDIIDFALASNDNIKEEVPQRFQRSCKDKVKNYSDLLFSLDVAEEVEFTSPIKEHYCDLCDASFEKAVGLKRHKKMKHNTIPSPISDLTLSKKSVSKQHFINDVKPDINESSLTILKDPKAQTEQRASSEDEQNSLSRPQSPDSKKSALKKYPCPECGKAFSLSCNLSRHMHIHRGTAPKFKCPQCGNLFTSKQGLRGHIRFIHTGERPFHCKMCPKSFVTNSDLTRHQSKHSEIRKYKCTDCGKKFKLRAALFQHIQRKRKEKTWHCELCPKRFTTKSGLKCHMVVHTKIKLYECESCQRQFSHRVSLEAHVRVHTGVMPYVCSACGKKFAHLSNRNRHMRQVHHQINL